MGVDIKHKEGGYRGIIYASEDKNLKITYQDGQYKALVVYEDIINVKLAGQGLTAAKGKVSSQVVDLDYSLNNRFADSYVSLVVNKEPVVQFKSESAQSFKLSININGSVAKYIQKDEIGQFEVVSNGVVVNGDIDYNKQVLTTLVRNDQSTILNGRIEMPEEERLMFKLKLEEDQIVAEGFKIITPYGHGKC